jgi:hypothetical protein
MATKHANGNSPRTESTDIAIVEPTVMGDTLAIPVGFIPTAETLKGYQLEHVLSVKEGHAIKGVYLGIGPSIDMTDDTTGEVRAVKTHRLQIGPNMIARLIGSVGLDSKMLDDYIGKEIMVLRGPKVDTRKGRRVNQYIVGPAIER